MMRHFHLIISLLFAFQLTSQTPIVQKLDPNMADKKADVSGIIWLDPKEEPFDLVGFEWIKQDNVYRRLPLNSKWNIPTAVDGLSYLTTGGQIRFRTNSKKIVVKVELMKQSGMHQMRATAQSGFDLYAKDKEILKYLKTTRFSVNDTIYEAELLNSNEQKMRDYTINFPLYNGVNLMFVGIEEGSVVENPTPFSRSEKFAIYGTSITHGGCVSRPGSTYSNILSRKLDAEFINLGFAGNGKGEPELAHLINQISNTSFIILDYEANASETIQNTIDPFIDILRQEHTATPILIMSKIRFAEETDGSETYKQLINNRDFQESLVHKRKRKGDDNIYFLDGSTVLGDDYYECTVDGVHPTDLGSYRIAEALLTRIKQILNQ